MQAQGLAKTTVGISPGSKIIKIFTTYNLILGIENLEVYRDLPGEMAEWLKAAVC